MQTLQEFIRFTKGWEYIIAIAAIFVFIGFWRLLSGTADGDSKPQANRTDNESHDVKGER